MFEFQLSKVATFKNDLLSGLTVALALVPEAVAFAFVAGVEPLVGLYAAFMVGLITAVIGGRPGMISVLQEHWQSSWFLWWLSMVLNIFLSP
jgi:SulP family sulfate permease